MDRKRDEVTSRIEIGRAFSADEQSHLPRMSDRSGSARADARFDRVGNTRFARRDVGWHSEARARGRAGIAAERLNQLLNEMRRWPAGDPDSRSEQCHSRL